MDRVLALPSHILDGKKIDPKPATPKSKSREAKTRKIFVGGVSQETSSEEVKKYFSQYGEENVNRIYVYNTYFNFQVQLRTL